MSCLFGDLVDLLMWLLVGRLMGLALWVIVWV